MTRTGSVRIVIGVRAILTWGSIFRSGDFSTVDIPVRKGRGGLNVCVCVCRGKCVRREMSRRFNNLKLPSMKIHVKQGARQIFSDNA